MSRTWKFRCIFFSTTVFGFILLLFYSWDTKADQSNSLHLHYRLLENTPSFYVMEPQKTNGIPRIIHQTWKTDDVPVRWRMAQETWKMQSRAFSEAQRRIYDLEFKYMYWNDTTLEQFVKKNFNWFLPTYLRYPYGIQRADAARYLLLYFYGGVYVDLDVACASGGIIRLLKSLTSNEGVVLFETHPFGFTNDIIISRKRHPFLRHVIANLADAAGNYISPYLTVMFTTGPTYFSTQYTSYLDKNQILTLPMKGYEKVYIYHVGGGSWHYLDAKIVWWCFENIPPPVVGVIALFMVFLILRCIFKYT